MWTGSTSLDVSPSPKVHVQETIVSSLTGENCTTSGSNPSRVDASKSRDGMNHTLQLTRNPAAQPRTSTQTSAILLFNGDTSEAKHSFQGRTVSNPSSTAANLGLACKGNYRA